MENNQNQIDKVIEFIKQNYLDKINLALEEDKYSIEIDFSELEKFDIDLANELLDNPENIMKIFKEALKSFDLPIESEKFEKITFRFFNLSEFRNIRIRDLREKHLGKLIVVDGIVKRASEVRPEVYLIRFKCVKCGMEVEFRQENRELTRPSKCVFCNSRGFEIVGEKLRDARWVVIEEPFEVRGGESPSELFIYLHDDLVDVKNRSKSDPGNRIKVVGILKKTSRRIGGKLSKQLEIFLEANYLESLETQWEDIEITEEDEKKILELSKDEIIYEKLVKSLAPSIYGFDEVKLALMLQMFGGCETITPDKVRVRGDINILLIGEPAVAKSQLLKTVTKIMPKAKYVSGKAATAAGLVATVTRDEEFLGGWVVEAGAVVLANRSIVAIDEFEKVDKKDIIALHEAMEQGSVSIAKASVVATLPAKTAVLAAANPKYGRFDEVKPISEQVDIPETILTRFDLKFALRDIPDIEKDKKIIEHVEKARYFNSEEYAKPEIDPELLRKYIAYARSRCYPKLTPEAAEKIKEFYLSLRKSSVGGVVSITPRQYESLVRLAQASARIQLREFVNVEDAERAINLMLFSLRQFGQDLVTGQIDIDKAEGQKITHEHRSKIKIIDEVLTELENKYGLTIPYDEVVKLAMERGVTDAESIIRKMQEVGEIFFPKPDRLQRIKRFV